MNASVIDSLFLFCTGLMSRPSPVIMNVQRLETVAEAQILLAMSISHEAYVFRYALVIEY